MYDHYSNVHFKEEVLEKIGNATNCYECNKTFHEEMRHNIIHVGVTHSFIENFLPKQYHIPKKVERKCKTLESETIHREEATSVKSSESNSVKVTELKPDSVKLNGIGNHMHSEHCM